jgi:hypothetical protein
MWVFAGHVDLRDDGADQYTSEVNLGETMIRGPEGMHRNPHYSMPIKPIIRSVSCGSGSRVVPGFFFFFWDVISTTYCSIAQAVDSDATYREAS